MSKKSEEEIAISEALSRIGLFMLSGINNVNSRPHSYMIGPKHIVYASDKFSGLLSEACIEQGEKEGKVHCMQPNCRVPYKNHTSDKVAFLQLTKNTTNEEATSALKDIQDILKVYKIDGLAFVETPENFRIT